MPRYSVPYDTFTGTIAADAVLCTTVDPFEWTFYESTTFNLRMALDLGIVHIEPGTAGQVDLAASFWIQADGTGPPTDTTPTATFFSWGTRHCVRHATKQTSFALGGGVFDYDVTLAAGDWEMYVGIGVELVVDLDTVAVTGYTPSGYIQMGI
jgi:hypothetical protein